MRCADCGQEIAQGQAACAYCGRPAHPKKVDSETTPPIRATLTAVQVSEDAPASGVWIATLDLHGQDVFVGRLPSSDIALEGDSLVSRRHVRLFAQHGAYYVEDLFSSNGTLVNGEELITPRRLAGGETIRVGTFELRYVCQSGEPKGEASRPQTQTSLGAGTLLGIESRPGLATSPALRGTLPHTLAAKPGTSLRAFAPTGLPPAHADVDVDTTRNPALSDIRLLKEQVVAIGRLVQQRAEDEARHVESLSNALIHTYGVLSSLLDTREGALRSTEAKVQALAALARETARDPEQTQQALRFAGHAGEIAVILEYLESAGIGRDVLRILRELQGHLAALPQVRAARGQRRTAPLGPQEHRQ